MKKQDKPIPDAVTFGAVTFEIEEVPAVKYEGGLAAATIQYKQQKIQLDSGYGLAQRMSHLWHEMCHYHLYRSGVENLLSPRQIEAVCDCLGAGFGDMMWTGQLVLKGVEGEDKPEATG